jgi:hypothetical protein
MEIEPIEGSEKHHVAMHSPADIWASKIAERLEARATESVPESAKAFSVPADVASSEPASASGSPVTSPAAAAAVMYSPAVLALAASAQMYSAQGVVSQLGGSASWKRDHEHPNDIKPVSRVEGNGSHSV